MTPDDDPLVAMRACVDQAIAEAIEPARLIRGHFEAYVAAGFTEPQALALTRDFAGIIWRGQRGRGSDDET